jgi:3-deoxy-D-arabino-heptulosonate 7-phosphate (DAHP) synthase
MLRVVHCIHLVLMKLTHEITKGKSASALATAATTAEPCSVRFGSVQLSPAQPVSDSAQGLTDCTRLERI